MPSSTTEGVFTGDTEPRSSQVPQERMRGNRSQLQQDKFLLGKTKAFSTVSKSKLKNFPRKAGIPILEDF